MPSASCNLTRIEADEKFSAERCGAALLIGGRDDRADRFYPEVHAAKWGGIGSLRLRHEDCERCKSSDKAAVTKDGLTFAVGKRSHLFQNTADGLKWSTIYAEPPKAEYEDFLIVGGADFDWHEQLELTEEEKAMGCDRPANVVNSFAIYGRQSGNYVDCVGHVTDERAFETGKLMHLYRQEMVAGDGARLWLPQYHDGDRLRVQLPPAKWFSEHPGPWVRDPTFGYTSVGATNSGLADGSLAGIGTFTPASNGTVQSISFYAVTNAVRVTLGLYSNGATYPATLLGDTAGGTTTGSAWNTQNCDAPIDVVAGTLYWLAWSPETWNTTAKYDTGATLKYKTGVGYTHGSLPSTFPVGGASYNQKHSIYATYTEPATFEPGRYFRQAGAS